MEIKIYKDGNDRKLDISGFSQNVNGVKTFSQFAILEALPRSNDKIDIVLNRTTKVVTGVPSSAFKDFYGASIGSDAGVVASKIEAIWSAREESDSYIIGDDLAQKSETTSFVHNDSIDNGAAVILSTEEFKAGVEGNYIEMDATGTNGWMDFYVETGGNETSHKALRIYGGSLTQGDARIDFLDTTIENLSITSLTEVPANLGTSGQVLAVNSAGTALEFVNQSGGSGSTNELDGIYLDYFTRSSAYGSGSYEGQVVKFGSETNLTTGKCYVLRNDGGSPALAQWAEADANFVTATKGLFGIALGSSASSDGFLVKGIRGMNTGADPGDIMYISTTSGTVTNDISSYTTGDHVRVIGYALSSTLLYLDPSPDYIELS